MSRQTVTEAREEAYELGKRAALVALLGTLVRELGYVAPDSAELHVAQLIAEREAAVSKLREMCREFGDNDWPNELHLADILEKHLGCHLEA